MAVMWEREGWRGLERRADCGGHDFMMLRAEALGVFVQMGNRILIQGC